MALLLLMAPIVAPQQLDGKVQCINPEANREVKALGKSFFSVRTPFQLNSPEFLAGWWYDRLDAKGKECRNGSLQLVALGGRSTDSYNLARYFTFNNSSTLHVAEANVLTPNTIPDVDISANQLGIYTKNGNFESFVSFKPRYSFGGLGISYRQEFAQRSDGRAFWFLASAPVLYVKTGMHIKENVINDGGGVATQVFPDAVIMPNATEAFAQPLYQYGKILDTNKARTALGDVTLLIGYKTVAHDDYDMNGYIGALVPTGNKVKGREVFEAMVGDNHHAGLILGSSSHVTLWECDNGARLDFEFNANGQYLFKGKEVRSLDLKNKPWSRYMQMYANVTDAQAEFAIDNPYVYTPGINVLTKELNVFPGFSSTSNTAVTFTTACGTKQLELGYNFYARQSEYVELACPWLVGPALKGSYPGGSTDSVQQIGNNYNAVNAVNTNPPFSIPAYNGTEIQVTDLDMLSATHPAIISNTLYVNASYRCDQHEYPRFVSLGGSYEFEEDNTTLNRWTIWFKGGISF